jgi:hypothetical protein
MCNSRGLCGRSLPYIRDPVDCPYMKIVLLDWDCSWSVPLPLTIVRVLRLAYRKCLLSYHISRIVELTLPWRKPYTLGERYQFYASFLCSPLTFTQDEIESHGHLKRKDQLRIASRDYDIYKSKPPIISSKLATVRRLIDWRSGYSIVLGQCEIQSWNDLWYRALTVIRVIRLKVLLWKGVNMSDRIRRLIARYLVRTPQFTAYRVRLVTIESDLDHIISPR